MISLPNEETMRLKTVRVLAAVLATVLLGACNSNRENVEVCRRYIQLVDETREGKVSPDEYFRRVQPSQIGQFQEGSSLRRLHEDLIESLQEEDLDRTQKAEEGLQDECMGTLNH